MKVVDAGVVVELLVGNLEFDDLNADELAVPHLADCEVMNVLRTLVRRGDLSERQGAEAMRFFLSLELSRYPVTDLRPRIWELRHNLSAYDAAYVALTEAIDAEALLTIDGRLARAPGLACRVDVLG